MLLIRRRRQQRQSHEIECAVASRKRPQCLIHSLNASVEVEANATLIRTPQIHHNKFACMKWMPFHFISFDVSG